MAREDEARSASAQKPLPSRTRCQSSAVSMSLERSSSLLLRWVHNGCRLSPSQVTGSHAGLASQLPDQRCSLASASVLHAMHSSCTLLCAHSAWVIGCSCVVCTSPGRLEAVPCHKADALTATERICASHFGYTFQSPGMEAPAPPSKPPEP